MSRRTNRQAGRQADMNKLIKAFCSFAYPSMNVSVFNFIQTTRKFVINGGRRRFVRRIISQFHCNVDV